MSWERAHRLWKAAELQLPQRRPRRKVAGSRPRPLPPNGPNSVWAYDFVFDGCANGQQIKCLTVVDEFTRECLAIDVPGSIRSKRVIEILTRLVSERGAPRYMRSDNGPEFVSKAILTWIVESNIESALIDPGKPWQNGTDESFNGKLRDECLSLEWFRSRHEARVIIETWRDLSDRLSWVAARSSSNAATPSIPDNLPRTCDWRMVLSACRELVMQPIEQLGLL